MPRGVRTEADPLYEFREFRERRVMTGPAITVGPDARLSRADDLLAERGVGVVVRDDVLRALRRSLELRNRETTAPTL
jgi:CBS domain-containing protein